MAVRRFALPPGLYYIKTTDGTGRNVVSPGADNQQLFVGTSSPDPSQQWLISGDGTMRAMNVTSGRFSLANLNLALVPQAVIRSTSSVQDDASNSYLGPIMANDSSKRRFALNGNNIELAAASSNQEWNFVPIK
ncbi:hypothetical protein NLJ89_g5461 [Agrocybe chaxingu]|uniref:Uncharacterized protein n=1 Tax=Agrocybe chaxingu TaxID=84603 RepID=A0A9W8K062_9AGAR|nr:hypothetical protein NLJ89_g5461 [Agrocybe chaxingu]